MSFGLNLGGLWLPKNKGKSVASGKFSLPADVVLSSSRGHRFVIVARKKQKEQEPEFDLWLFSEEKEKEQDETQAATLPTLQDGNVSLDEVPF